LKPPTCRVCGAAHWGTEPHAFGPSKESAKVARQVRVLTVPKAEPRPPGFDRKAYNREYNRKYMADRRAKAKAARETQSPK